MCLGLAGLPAAGQAVRLPTPPGPRVVSRTPAARASILGTAFSPANFPQSSDADVSQFFDLAAQLGSQATMINAWKDRTPLDVLRQIEARTHEKGMRFVLYLDPIALDSSRTHAAVPPGVPGTSFRDASVRTAYTADALAYREGRPKKAWDVVRTLDLGALALSLPPRH